MRMIGIPKNFIDTRPGMVYSWGGSACTIQTASGTVVTFPQSEERAFSGLSIYGHSTQDGTPSPENPVPIVSAGDEGEINVTVSDGGTQSQTLTLSTPGGLPGIPVASGGNYTDENGQQWVCDEIDLARGKYVQRVKKLSIDDFTIDPGVRPGTTGHRFAAITPDRTVLLRQPTLCNYFPFDSTPNGSFSIEGNYIATDEVGKVFIRVTDDITLDEFHQTYPDLVAYYILETPIETDLSDEEIVAYKELHTYSPATTVSNDAAAWMEVGYLTEE